MHILLKKAIKERFGKLNPLQLEAFKVIARDKKSVLIVAPTGSGKTEAAIIPALDVILQENLPPISVLYIAPLKALNRDLLERLRWWGEKLGLRVEVRHGDTPYSRRARQVKNPPHILIITPETLPIILTMKSLRPFLKNIRFVIVDEVVELVDNKRGAQLSLNLERLALIADFLRIGLSATVGNEREIMEWLKAQEIVKPRIKKRYKVTVLYPKPKEEDKELAEKLKVPLEVAARLRVLWEIVEKYNRALIFVNTRQFAEILAHRLKIWGKPVEVHHGSLSKEARIEAERKLKEGEIKALICTSSMELGIDIGDVDVVIQYMSPRQVNRLIQRAGRSRHRLWEVSEAYIIATSPEDYLQSLVIAKRAMEGKLESVRPYKNALDVLAHFIVGLLIEYREIKLNEPYRLAKEAYPYRDLKWEEYLEVVKLLEDAGIVKVVNDILKLGRRSYKYYFENLSTIPDEVSYLVLDVGSGKIVGRLDENFVMEIEEGSEFIMHGRSWFVIEISEDGRIIKVRESGNVEGAIPSWEGELIPVPYEVAIEVGRLKRMLLYEVDKAMEIMKGVNIDPGDLESIREELVSDKFSTDRDVIIEVLKKVAIIHADFGNKINEALARYVWSLLSLKYGMVFSIRSYAHAIVIWAPFTLNPEEIKELLLVRGRVEDIVIRGIKFSPIYKWKMLNVARRIGALSKTARIRSVEKLFEGSIIEKETLNEILQEKIDINGASRVLSKMERGEIRVRGFITEKPSKVASQYLQYSGEFLLTIPLDEKEIEDMFYRSLLEKELVFVCTNCGWSWRTKVGRVMDREDIKCPKCGSVMLAPLHPLDAESFTKALKKIRQGKSPTKEEERSYLKGLKASDLFRVYGKHALLALATYGVGVEGASRVLGSVPSSKLIKELMKLEKMYIKTRKFWD
ncbi:large helicase [Thermococcus chitonophagus]|nr:DEAD/DEAH box helicase [Thermococcus chitonophagus]ASJ17598.1 large helicase [Thermococcus chitonophagus]